jgi:Leucine-rich repeat (LRR) protein
MRVQMVVVLLLVLGGSTSVAQAPKKELPKPLPENLLNAWKEAGAQFAWSDVKMSTLLGVTDKPEPGAIPIFIFDNHRKEGVVAKLPIPDAPFGILFVNSSLTNSGLKELVQFKTLTRLEFLISPVTDTGLKELAPLTNLTKLVFGGNELTDSRLKVLREIGLLHALHQATTADGKRPTNPEEVASLDLSDNPVTGAGLKQLAHLKNLTSLNLYGTKVTDAGLKELAPLKNLNELNLNYTKVTDAGLKELAPLKNLTSLYVGKTDTSLKVLREIGLLHSLGRTSDGSGKRPTKPEEVTSFDLTGTGVTDAGLKELAPFKNLTSLYLRNTKVTAKGVAELRKTVPNFRVIRDY